MTDLRQCYSDDIDTDIYIFRDEGLLDLSGIPDFYQASAICSGFIFWKLEFPPTNPWFFTNFLKKNVTTFMFIPRPGRCHLCYCLALFENSRDFVLGSEKRPFAKWKHRIRIYQYIYAIYLSINLKDEMCYLMNSIDYGITCMFYKISYQIYAFINFKTEFDLAMWKGYCV